MFWTSKQWENKISALTMLLVEEQKHREKMKQDLEFRTKQHDAAFENWQKEKRSHDETFQALDNEVGKVKKLEAQNKELVKMRTELSFDCAQLRRQLSNCTATQEIADELRADRDQWRERANLKAEPTALRELQKRFDDLLHTNEGLRLELENERAAHDGCKKALLIELDKQVAKINLQEQLENAKFTQWQIMPNGHFIVKAPPAKGQWKLASINGEVAWVDDEPWADETYERCDHKWRRLNGEMVRCQKQQGHDGDHTWEPIKETGNDCPCCEPPQCEAGLYKGPGWDLVKCKLKCGHDGDHFFGEAATIPPETGRRRP